MYATLFTIQFFKYKKWDTDNLYLLHCNHHIREESDEEEKLIKERFTSYQVTTFSRDKKEESNTEAALRERRYACFKEFCNKNAIKKIIF